MLRIVKYWDGLPRDIAEFLSLEITQELTRQGPWQPALVGPALFRSTEEVVSRYPFQPELFCDSVTSSPELFRLQ